MSTSISSRIHLPEPFPETARLDRERVTELLERLVDQFAPTRILLFGSIAKGTATEESDLDLVVFVPHEGRNMKFALKMELALDTRIPIDIFVRHPEDAFLMDYDGETWDYVLWEALKTGSVIYEARA